MNDNLVTSRINPGQVVHVAQGHEDDNFYGQVEAMHLDDFTATLVGGMVIGQDMIRALKITEVFGNEDT
jgi:hypothetical protein